MQTEPHLCVLFSSCDGLLFKLMMMMMMMMVTDIRAASVAFLFLSHCFIVFALCLCLANKLNRSISFV